MATFNGARYIQGQLDSFLAQTRQPDELVVCDDASEDATREIVQCFREKAPFEVVVVENQKRHGHVKNFEKTLSYCSGDIVFLSDQDDVWFPEKIEVISNWLEQHPDVHVVQSDMEIASETLQPWGVTKGENVVSLGHGENGFHTGCGTAIRGEWLVNIALPIPDRWWGHDNWIHRVALAVGARGFCRSALMYYRRHDTNASNWMASRGERVTIWDSIKAHGLENVTESWEKECNRLREIEYRLVERRLELYTLGFGVATELALRRLRAQKGHVQARIACMRMKRWRRVPRVLTLWAQGGYEQFSGWKSAVKDVIRP